MDSTMLITIWLMTGAFIGGVVTPVLAANRAVNGWLAMLGGMVVGMIGNVVLLVPVWLGLSRAPRLDDHRPAWQRDAITLEGVRQGAAADGVTAGEQAQSLTALLRDNFWPAARADREHSHRGTYVGVFVALAVITAIEVAISFWDGAPFNIAIPLSILSAGKVMLVVLFFMHLRYDSRWYSWIFAFSLPFAIIVLAVLAVAE